MAARITKENSWAIQIQFRETDLEFLSRLVKNLTKGIQQTDHPSIATVDLTQETRQSLAFNVTSEEISPLRHSPVRPSSNHALE